MRRLASLFVVVAVLLLSSLAVVGAQEATPTTNDPAAVPAAFVAAIQANDVDAFAALFAPEGVLVTPSGSSRVAEEI